MPTSVAVSQEYSLRGEGATGPVIMTVQDSMETGAAVSETELVREAQAGNDDAFERL